MSADSTQAADRNTLAIIDEAVCIGCTLCLQACPFDAIVGAAQRMHTVIADACTGCALCLPPCPVDCIQMVPAQPLATAAAARAQEREQQRILRLAKVVRDNTTSVTPQIDPRTVQRALARARARLGGRR